MADQSWIGSLITFEPTLNPKVRIAGVIVEAILEDRSYLCVALDKDAGRQLASQTGYKLNRGWYLSNIGRSQYRPRPLTDPTDEQLAAAMRIMLTGYVPGVDDE